MRQARVTVPITITAACLWYVVALLLKKKGQVGLKANLFDGVASQKGDGSSTDTAYSENNTGHEYFAMCNQ